MLFYYIAIVLVIVVLVLIAIYRFLKLIRSKNDKEYEDVIGTVIENERHGTEYYFPIIEYTHSNGKTYTYKFKWGKIFTMRIGKVVPLRVNKGDPYDVIFKKDYSVLKLLIAAIVFAIYLIILIIETN